MKEKLRFCLLIISCSLSLSLHSCLCFNFQVIAAFTTLEFLIQDLVLGFSIPALFWLQDYVLQLFDLVFHSVSSFHIRTILEEMSK